MIKILDTINALGLTCEYSFIPFSQSRNAKETYPSLNYRVTIKRNDCNVLTTDYGMGCAHVPGYKQLDKSIDHANMLKLACETGKVQKIYMSRTGYYSSKTSILPKIEDVFYSLTMDAGVLDSGGFENWCCEYGYDTDSRQAEKTYKTCLEIALALRGYIGEEGLNALREVYQDY